jgi:hypothetical protein
MKLPASAIFLMLVTNWRAAPANAHRWPGVQPGEADSLPTFHLQGPTVRIGSVDDPAYAFGTVLALVEAPDGTLYSIHRSEAVVHRWTPDGKAAGTIGRRGKGPGEFLAPSALGFFGDTLWVMDLAAHRASYFRSDGTYLRSAEPRVAVAPSPTNPAALVPHPAQPFRDGRWYGRGSGRAVDLASGRLTSVPFVAMDSTGAVLDTMWVLHYRPYDVLVVPIDPPRHYAYLPQPFGDEPLVSAEGGGTLLIVDRRVGDVASGTLPRFWVTRVGERGDTLLHVSFPYQPMPLPRRRVQSMATEMASRAYDAQNVARSGMTKAKFEKEAADRLFAPGHLPAVGTMLVGADGSVWLWRLDPAEHRSEWWVIDAQGHPARWVLAPPSLRILRAGEDHVWGVVSGRYGVDYIVRYEIEPGAGVGAPPGQ